MRLQGGLEVYHYKLLAITHKTASLAAVGKWVLEEETLSVRLAQAKNVLRIEELLYIATCNRVEFFFVSERTLDDDFAAKLLGALYPEQQNVYDGSSFLKLEGEQAIRHLFEVAASLDSMVVGEREILKQVRNAYEKCKTYNLTGDYIRIAATAAIRTAKQVFTETRIGEKPVSVVSLAFHELLRLKPDKNARIVLIGAGKTATLMGKFLSQNGYHRIYLYNRNPQKANGLAELLHTTARPLNALYQHKEGFDVLISATSAPVPIVTEVLYSTLLGGEKDKKIILDLAIPADVEVTLPQYYPMHYIGISSLQRLADENLAFRQQEINKARTIIEKQLFIFRHMIKELQLKQALQDLPQRIKSVREKAVQQVFSKQIASLDEPSRQVLNEVLEYMEKKCVSIPMSVAKKVLLQNSKSAPITQR